LWRLDCAPEGCTPLDSSSDSISGQTADVLSTLAQLLASDAALRRRVLVCLTLTELAETAPVTCRDLELSELRLRSRAEEAQAIEGVTQVSSCQAAQMQQLAAQQAALLEASTAVVRLCRRVVMTAAWTAVNRLQLE